MSESEYLTYFMSYYNFLELQAAMDGHFGIWTVSSLYTNQKG